MRTALHISRAALVASAGVVVALALSAAPGAGAEPSTAARIDVVGSGTLTKNRVTALARPKAGAKQVGTLQAFRPDFRPQFVLALDAVRDRNGNATWYRISLPGRPNGKTGWVRASAVELRPVKKRIVVYRSERRFEFWNGSRLVRAGKVAVGKRGAETPAGLFYVTWKFDPTIDPDWAILGKYAFETSAYSKLTDWPGGGIVGVHGTPWPELLGQAVSHGCVRLHNRDILFLRSRVPVGTPVKIVS